jgi:hypothetical protein
MVAPPGNQTANGENKPQPRASEETCLLDRDPSASPLQPVAATEHMRHHHWHSHITTHGYDGYFSFVKTLSRPPVFESSGFSRRRTQKLLPRLRLQTYPRRRFERGTFSGDRKFHGDFGARINSDVF